MNKLLIAFLLIVSLSFFWSCNPDAPGIDVSEIISLAVSGTDFNESTKTADFGTVEVGSSSTIAATIENTSTSAITINSISNSNATDYTVTTAELPFTVEPGAETSFSVEFAPSTNTSLTASITITLSTDVSLSDTLTLKGEGNYAPSAVFGITVSGAATYTGINGFYTKQTDSYTSDNENDNDDGRPLYKMTNGGTDYFLYYFIPEVGCWGIKDGEPVYDGPWWEEIAVGPIAYIYVDTANSDYPPEEGPSGDGSWVENLATPTSITVKTGITRTGENTIAADYQFDDQDGDAEGSSTYKWYICDTVNGSYSVISGASSETYGITFSDNGKYIKVGVTALDSNGFAGAEVKSDPYYAYYILSDIVAY